MRVLVPLGTKTYVGIVFKTNITIPDTLDPQRVKPVTLIPDSQPAITLQQLQLWQWIADYYLSPIGDVMAAALPAKATDKIYELDKAPRRIKIPVYTDEVEDIHPLSPAQQKALTSISQQWGKKDVVLLHGVTSSGKTEVYMHLIEAQLAAGKQVLYLVPEIALTTQLTRRLSKVFGDKLWVYHSRISDGQRMEVYRQLVTTNQPRLIVGARSAVFLPFHNLGLIIVDEEHDPSYKQQDPAPRYHARSVAIMVAAMVKAKVLLGTATPAIETYHNAMIGKYGYVEMSERYAGLQLPEITLIDLTRQYHRKEMYGHFADPLVVRIEEELNHEKQIILFQNRRGYAPLLLCNACGHSPKCPDCDVPLTLHLQDRELRCHYCGYKQPIPQLCPKCGGSLRILGFGTERLEDEVHHLFPSARVARLDWDTTRNKNDYEEIIGAFGRHEVDILIGTQMVTKGLHFDDVSLVAVLSADHLFNNSDYASFEHSYQMLEQVSGRAGRKGTQGQVIIQTWDKAHPILKYLKEHDYKGLYAEQIQEREQFRYPPFYRLIVVTIRHMDSQLTQGAAAALQVQLEHVFGKRCSAVITPAVAKMQRYYLRQIRLRIEASANQSRAKQLLETAIWSIQKDTTFRRVQILVDVDPT